MSDKPVPARIYAEITGHDVLLFMKGTPQSTRCGFSKAAAKAIAEIKKFMVKRRS